MSSQILTSGIAAIGDLTLRSGRVLPDVKIAYATTGTLNAARDNVVLVTHGFTSSHLFIGRASETASEGTWSGLVGPGRAIDTDRFFVVSSNMLGSSFGSTSPSSINPSTGRPYGPDFPSITGSDIIEAQRVMLAMWGITKLHAVVGPSYGGFQGLVWAIEQPDAMRGVSMSVSGIRPPKDTSPDDYRRRFAADPRWNGGHHYETGGIVETMVRLREETMQLYGVDVLLAHKFPDPQERALETSRQALAWAKVTDPNSMIVLAEAMNGLDIASRLHRIKARVQYVLSRSDRLFPPSEAAGVLREFAEAGVQAEYYEIDSDYGHHAAGTDSAKWQNELARFLQSL
ncbi:MAG TPA: alpha/beta fold hydrolase [Ensifer sp.]|nr:alpha/beta fold hydrolase [Ensifer sp.]